MERQIVWVASDASTFAAICEACLSDPDGSGGNLRYRRAKVEGSMRPDADVRFTRCRRGHSLCVRRTLRGPPRPRAGAPARGP